MEAVPPALSVEENLNWQGHLRVNDDVTVPTFRTARLAIQVNILVCFYSALLMSFMKDFVVLEIQTDDEKIRHGHSISLVTESWSELAT